MGKRPGAEPRRGSTGLLTVRGTRGYSVPTMTRHDDPAKRKLPVGIQTFREVREEGYYYVDKTAYARQMVDGGKHYFLSRPRRFGKSLFVDTLKELFEGNAPLFAGLDIHDRWDWSVRHPVVRLDFSAGDYTDPDYLQDEVAAQLDAVERRAGLDPGHARASIRFRQIIEALHERTGQRVVVLVDEYDKPILDALARPDVARSNREALRGLYAAIKFSDAHVKFTLLTGVSKFSKVSLFSGLNNLKDITLTQRYAGICGYTDADLDTVFAPELADLDRQAIRDWYNGYSWLGEDRVYNPFDILLLFDTGEFKAHWFETGTPRFLIDTLLRRGVASPDLDGMCGTEALLSAFDVDEMSTEALLFQTGYLTILDEEERNGGTRYRLGYPNREVRQSLNERLLYTLLPEASRRLADNRSLRELLARNDFEGLEALFRSVFAGIPYEWHTRNEIARYEGYYASVFYSCFAGQGLDIVAEESTSRGRADMTVRCGGHVYLFEFKTVERASEGTALTQLGERGYADKYRHLGVPVHLIGVECSRADRNIAAFAVERA